ncbi:MAG: hypothetical protein HS128_23335 [Ideonella sp.]|nr:hypothetical protein [Ideonella sp.]
MLAAAQLHHGFRAGCAGCAARSAARSQHFFAARRAGSQSWEYRELLRLLGVSHEQVKAAYASDAMPSMQQR